MNSKRKGADGEREFAELLRANGFEARRGQQFAGGGNSPDVVHSIPAVHFEVKRVERLNVNVAIDQAERDAPFGSFYCVAHRQNGRPWLATVPMEQYLTLHRRIRELEHSK